MIDYVRIGGPEDGVNLLPERQVRKQYRHSNRQGIEVRELIKAFDIYGIGSYSVSREEAKNLAHLYENIEGLENMNMEFLAAAIVLVKQTMLEDPRNIITPYLFQKYAPGVLEGIRSNRESVKESTLLRYSRAIIKYRFPDRFEQIFGT